MGSKTRDHGDPALLAFVRQLIEDESLDADAEVVARKLLDQGAAGMGANERAILDQEVIEPYLGACEGCNDEPGWAEVLHVYDTGFCAACFDKLDGAEISKVRPDWMPLKPPPVVDEDLPSDAEQAPAAALVAAPLGA